MENKDLKTVITIGVFDGVHLGHRSLIEKVKEFSKKHDAVSTAITFDPLPEEYFNKKKGIVLTLPEEKKKLLIEAGIKFVVFFEFNENLANLRKDDFLEKLRKFNPMGIVVGEDFRFGKGAEGTPEDIKSFFKNDAEVIVLPLLEKDGKVIKSSEIRRLLLIGDVESAGKMLGRYYTVSGEVVIGKKIGKALGYPTANIEVNPRKLLPLSGVYAGIAVVDGKETFPAAAFVPERKMDERLVVEVHLLNFDGDLYGRRITLNFVKRVSDVKEFRRLEELQEKIREDVKKVIKELSALK